MLRRLALAFLLLTPATALAQQGPPSQCLAIAQNVDEVPVHYASLATPVQSNDDAYTVTISFQGHSTYLIESPTGATIATDYAGWMTDPVVPLGVTMNRAHSSHWTDRIQPETKYVMRGWGEDGDIARHNLMVGDILVRNVTTDIMRFGTVPDGNSIFIFEVAGLCIGHLGHLHHRLSDDQYAKIGRLDVVMVPVDGGITMTHVSAKEILDRMRSSIVLPMHVRSYGALPEFLNYLGDGFARERLSENRLRVSLRSLPDRPTVFILPGVGAYGGDR